jgi:hypothetical protein
VTNALDVNELAEEVAGSNFADKRLNKRLRNLVLGLASAPKTSLPKALDSAGLEGAYRFVSNPRVTPDQILSGHVSATVERCEREPTVLIAHDSTSFSYRYDGEREGLGRVRRDNKKSKQNFFAHFSLAVTADGERRSLGMVGFKPWSRLEAPTGTEYQRWEEQMRATSQRFGSPQKIIHLADREADDYEMFWALQRDQHRFVVRCQFNRLLQEGEQTTKLRDHFTNSAALVERSVPVSQRASKRCEIMSKIYPARNERMARLSVAAATVQLKKPTKARPHGASGVPSIVTINVVRIWEPEPPQGEEPIEWYLYTSEPIETAEQQLAVVDYYRARWVIEEYIKVIKTGCDFEKRQLQDYDALINLLAVFLPIAHRLLLLRSEVARAPEQPALNVVSQDELDVLRALGRRKLPQSPTAEDAYLAIAELGGYIKYKKTPPGWLTLARGFEELQTLTAGWRAAKLQLHSDQR